MFQVPWDTQMIQPIFQDLSPPSGQAGPLGNRAWNTGGLGPPEGPAKCKGITPGALQSQRTLETSPSEATQQASICQ